MATPTTSTVKAWSKANSRFNVACDGVYLLESVAGISEVFGVDTSHGRTRTCDSHPHAWINYSNSRFGGIVQAG